jgi:hypothetical protein
MIVFEQSLGLVRQFLPELLLGGAVMSVLLGIAAFRSTQVDRGRLVRGFRLAAIAGVVVGGAIALIITIAFTGRDFFGTITFEGALRGGVLIGAPIGLGLFLILLGLVAGRLLLRTGRNRIMLLGAPFVSALAIVVALSLLPPPGPPEPPAIYVGSMQLTLARNAETAQNWDMTGTCERQSDSYVEINADNAREDSGRAAFGVFLSTERLVSLSIFVQSWSPPEAAIGPGFPSTGIIELQPGWTAMAGRVNVIELVPFTDDNHTLDPTTHWSGSLSWACDRPV